MWDWNELERTCVTADRRRVAELVWRAATRLAPVIATAGDEYGPEADEWLNAVRASLGVVERFVGGLPVTRFTLDLAADVARSAATARANAARLLGPSRAGEDAELAFAAAAFAADVCRATTPQRVAAFAVQAVRAVDASGRVSRERLVADVTKLADGEFGPLWPDGEPEWSAAGWKRLTGRAFPVVLRVD